MCALFVFISYFQFPICLITKMQNATMLKSMIKKSDQAIMIHYFLSYFL